MAQLPRRSLIALLAAAAASRAQAQGNQAQGNPAQGNPQAPPATPAAATPGMLTQVATFQQQVTGVAVSPGGASSSTSRAGRRTSRFRWAS